MHHFKPDSQSEYVIDVLGADFARKLALHFGGVELWVPRDAPDEHEIVVALGREDADRLTHYFGGEKIYIPLTTLRARDGGTIGEDPRVAFIRECSGLGLARHQIALRLGISIRQLRRIIGKHGISEICSRQPARNGMAASVIERRDEIAAKVIGGELTPGKAARMLGLSAGSVNALALKFRRFGTTDPAAARKTGAPAVSNGGLTALDAASPSPTPQTIQRAPVAA